MTKEILTEEPLRRSFLSFQPTSWSSSVDRFSSVDIPWHKSGTFTFRSHDNRWLYMRGDHKPQIPHAPSHPNTYLCPWRQWRAISMTTEQTAHTEDDQEMRLKATVYCFKGHQRSTSKLKVWVWNVSFICKWDEHKSIKKTIMWIYSTQCPLH